MKTCYRCGKRKPLSEYHKRSSNRDGLNSHCITCELIRKRNWDARKQSGEPAGSIYYLKIPTERLRPALEEWLSQNNQRNLTITMIRRIYAVTHEQKIVKFDTADKLLIELGLEHLWHVPPPEGLSDLYECAPGEAGLGGPSPLSLGRDGRGRFITKEAA